MMLCAFVERSCCKTYHSTCIRGRLHPGTSSQRMSGQSWEDAAGGPLSFGRGSCRPGSRTNSYTGASPWNLRWGCILGERHREAPLQRAFKRVRLVPPLDRKFIDASVSATYRNTATAGGQVFSGDTRSRSISAARGAVRPFAGCVRQLLLAGLGGTRLPAGEVR